MQALLSGQEPSPFCPPSHKCSAENLTSDQCDDYYYYTSDRSAVSTAFILVCMPGAKVPPYCGFSTTVDSRYAFEVFHVFADSKADLVYYARLNAVVVQRDRARFGLLCINEARIPREDPPARPGSLLLKNLGDTSPSHTIQAMSAVRVAGPGRHSPRATRRVPPVTCRPRWKASVEHRGRHAARSLW